MERNRIITIAQCLLVVVAIAFIIMAVTTMTGLGVMAGIGFILIAVSLHKWKDKAEKDTTV